MARISKQTIWMLCAFGTLIIIGVHAAPVTNKEKISTDTTPGTATQLRRDVVETLIGLAKFKRKLQQQGLINIVDENVIDAYDTPSEVHLQFNPVEMLQMLPLIINLLRKGKIDHSDTEVLKTIFGSMWPLIEDEVKRRQAHLLNPASNVAMDPVMKAILRAQHYSHFVQFLPKVEESGIGASLNRNKRNGLIEEPSQKILTTAALLIEEQKARLRKSSTHGINEAAKVLPKSGQRRRRRSIHEFEGIDGHHAHLLQALIGEDDYSDEEYETDEPYDEEKVNANKNWHANVFIEETDSTEEDDSYDPDSHNAMLKQDDATLLRNMYGTAPTQQDNHSIMEMIRLVENRNKRNSKDSAKRIIPRIF